LARTMLLSCPTKAREREGAWRHENIDEDQGRARRRHQEQQLPTEARLVERPWGWPLSSARGGADRAAGRRERQKGAAIGAPFLLAWYTRGHIKSRGRRCDEDTIVVVRFGVSHDADRPFERRARRAVCGGRANPFHGSMRVSERNQGAAPQSQLSSLRASRKRLERDVRRRRAYPFHESLQLPARDEGEALEPQLSHLRARASDPGVGGSRALSRGPADPLHEQLQVSERIEVTAPQSQLSDLRARSSPAVVSGRLTSRRAARAVVRGARGSRARGEETNSTQKIRIGAQRISRLASALASA
jgi:hypothetical protein